MVMLKVKLKKLSKKKLQQTLFISQQANLLILNISLLNLNLRKMKKKHIKNKFLKVELPSATPNKKKLIKIKN